MKTKIDMNGNPLTGKAVWQVKTICGKILFAGNESECRAYKGGIHATQGFYLNAIPANQE